MGKLFGAGKRLLTGESMFTTVFIHEDQGKKRVAFAAASPAKSCRCICANSAARCWRKKRRLSVCPPRACRWHRLQRQLGAGLFGGEGFILQKLEGDAVCFCMPAARWWKNN